MAFTHGSSGYLLFGVTDISSYLESTDLNLTRESADIKVYSAAWVQRVMGIISAALNAAAAYEPTLDGLVWTALTSSTVTAFEWGPQGNGDGAVKYSGNVWVSSSVITVPSTGKAAQTFVCLPSGTISKGTFSA